MTEQDKKWLAWYLWDVTPSVIHWPERTEELSWYIVPPPYPDHAPERNTEAFCWHNTLIWVTYGDEPELIYCEDPDILEDLFTEAMLMSL